MKQRLAVAALILIATAATAQHWPDYWQSNAHEVWRSFTIADVEAIIRSGGEVNEADRFGWTPLMYVCRYNADPDVVRALTAAGARVGITEGIVPFRTVLMIAAEHTIDAAVLHALLNAGADPAATDLNGNTALDYAQENAALSDSEVLDSLSS